jgi:hypothetical protein
LDREEVFLLEDFETPDFAFDELLGAGFFGDAGWSCAGTTVAARKAARRIATGKGLDLTAVC